jgi:glutamyl/glutaminyl-tRNA synthetase
MPTENEIYEKAQEINKERIYCHSCFLCKSETNTMSGDSYQTCKLTGKIKKDARYCWAPAEALVDYARKLQYEADNKSRFEESDQTVAEINKAKSLQHKLKKLAEENGVKMPELVKALDILLHYGEKEKK